MAGLADADLHMSEVELTDALSAHVKEKGRMPEMDHAALARDYPVLYQSMLQLIHNSGERINHLMEGRRPRVRKRSKALRRFGAPATDFLTLPSGVPHLRWGPGWIFPRRFFIL